MKNYSNVTMRERNSENAAIISVEGRNYPLDIFYSKHPVEFYATSAVEVTLVIDNISAPCVILVFLASQNDVEEAHKLLKDLVNFVSQNLKYSILVV